MGNLTGKIKWDRSASQSQKNKAKIAAKSSNEQMTTNSNKTVTNLVKESSSEMTVALQKPTVDRRTNVALVMCSPNLPVYDGIEYFGEYLEHFAYFCENFELTEREQLLVLPFVLKTAKAELAYAKLSNHVKESGSWGEVTTALLDIYYPKRNYDVILRKLLSAIQGNLSVKDFVDDIQELSYHLPRDKCIEDFLRIAFIKGLRTNIQIQVLRRRPKTFYDAVEAAELEESFETSECYLMDALKLQLHNCCSKPFSPKETEMMQLSYSYAQQT